MRNKPNLGHGKANGKWFARKGLRLSGPAKSIGKTKPIQEGVSSLNCHVLRQARNGPDFKLHTWPKALRAKRTQFGGGRTARGVDCAKRSQFLDCGLRIGDRLAVGRLACPGKDKMCKTKPISAGRDTPPFHCSIIPPFQPDTDCAKRTQFGGTGSVRQSCKCCCHRGPNVRNEPSLGHGSKWQVPFEKGVMAHPACKRRWKNKANSRPGREWAGAGTVDYAKRTQLGREFQVRRL